MAAEEPLRCSSGEAQLQRLSTPDGVPDVVLHLVMGYIDDPADRAVASLVSRHWRAADGATRQHVTVAMSYAASPEILARRFPALQSLKLKSRPRAAMFNLIPPNWGGAASPWVECVCRSLTFLRSLHLRRMTVRDEDLESLAVSKAGILVSLKLDRCSGFSTHGVAAIARSCRKLETLFLEESSITDKDNGWVRELATNNSVLETLNFYLTELVAAPEDLNLLARNCKSLKTLKINDCDISNLVELFHAAVALEEFGGGCTEEGAANKYTNFYFPPSLRCLGLFFLQKNEMPLLLPYSSTLKKLDLQYTCLKTEDHCQLIQHCPNLEILEVMDIIGDVGLGIVAATCKKLRRLRVERGEDESGILEDELGKVTQVGLMAIAQGCTELEHLAIHVSDITNAALESFGTHSKSLRDFRLVLLDRERVADLPLDNGVRSLLRGCSLKRFALYLRPGGLSDVGLGYIGEHSGNIKYMLLGNVGDSDSGLLRFARGCWKLQKLELRSCCFSERALALAVTQLPSLTYVWVHGYRSSSSGSDLMAMARPFWNIEFIPPRPELLDSKESAEPEDQNQGRAQVLAYYSLVGRRTDCPEYVVPLHPQ